MQNRIMLVFLTTVYEGTVPETASGLRNEQFLAS